MLGADLFPGRVEFVGDERRQTGGRSLPLVQMLGQDDDSVVRADMHKWLDELTITCGCLGSARQMHRNHETADGSGRDFQE